MTLQLQIHILYKHLYKILEKIERQLYYDFININAVPE